MEVFRHAGSSSCQVGPLATGKLHLSVRPLALNGLVKRPRLYICCATVLTHELGHWIRLVDLGNSQDCEQYPQDCPPDNPCVAGEANLRTMCQPINYTESLYIRTLHHYDKRDADVVY